MVLLLLFLLLLLSLLLMFNIFIVELNNLLWCFHKIFPFESWITGAAIYPSCEGYLFQGTPAQQAHIL